MDTLTATEVEQCGMHGMVSAVPVCACGWTCALHSIQNAIVHTMCFMLVTSAALVSLEIHPLMAPLQPTEYCTTDPPAPRCCRCAATARCNSSPPALVWLTPMVCASACAYCCHRLILPLLALPSPHPCMHTAGKGAHATGGAWGGMLRAEKEHTLRWRHTQLVMAPAG